MITVALNNLHADWSDGFFYGYTQMFTWIPLYLCLVYFLLRDHRREGLWVLAFAILTVLLTDGFSSGICKPLFHRLRPTRDPSLDGMIVCVNGYRGGLYGFISSHAANCFGLAVFLSSVFRKKGITILLLLWAALNAYSRIYLGVHFVGDILFGTLAGVSLALLVHCIYRYVANKYPTRILYPFPIPSNAFYCLFLLYVTLCLLCLLIKF